MGEQINRNNDKLIEEVGGRTTAQNTTGGSSTDTTAKSGGNRGNRSGGSGGSGGKTTDEQKVVPTMVNVDVEEQKRLERNRKRRERYQQQKAEGTLKPKKVNTKKKATDGTLGTEQITNLLKTVSMLIASRPNQQHWLLSDAEIKSLAEPITKILQESKAFESIGEHSNGIALSIACITILLPRALKSIMDLNEKKKKEKEVKNNVRLLRNKTKNNSDDRGNDRPTTANGKNNSNNEYWFGQAISY